MKTRVKLFSEVKVSRLFPNVFLLLFLFAKVAFRLFAESIILPIEFSVFHLFQRKKDALESPKSSRTTTRVEPERKRQRKSKELSSTPVLSTTKKSLELEQETESLQLCEGEEIRAEPCSSNETTGQTTDECASCRVLQNEKRQLDNKVKTLREKLKDKRDEQTKLKKKLVGMYCGMLCEFVEVYLL